MAVISSNPLSLHIDPFRQNLLSEYNEPILSESYLSPFLQQNLHVRARLFRVDPYVALCRPVWPWRRANPELPDRTKGMKDSERAIRFMLDAMSTVSRV